jgi:hypothetical protein
LVEKGSSAGAWLGIERKESTAHVVAEQNRRGKQKGCAAAAKRKREAGGGLGRRQGRDEK